MLFLVCSSINLAQWFPKLGAGPQVGSPNYFVGSPDDKLDVWLNVIASYHSTVNKCIQGVCTFIK